MGANETMGANEAMGANESAKQTPYRNSPIWLAAQALTKTRQRDAARGSDVIALTLGGYRPSLYPTQVRVHCRKG